MLFHQHLLVKAFVKTPPRSESQMVDWLRDTVEAIGMKIVFGPYAKYVDAVGNKGVTGAVVIETSHLACHVWDEPSPAMLQLDIYSCAAFEEKTIIERLDQAFGLVSYETMMIDRNDDLKVVSHKKMTSECIFSKLFRSLQLTLRNIFTKKD